MMRNAQHAAADLNVESFQGLVEVIQNADDLRATEVRFALRQHDGIAAAPCRPRRTSGHMPSRARHGPPVSDHKDQSGRPAGRFGIGLKTLNRVAQAITVHSDPYHFSGNQLSLAGLDPEPALGGFYDPANDTMLVLDLNADFEELALKEWFDAWEDVGLLFLTSVCRFRWCTIDGKTIAEKALSFDSWEAPGFASFHGDVLEIKRRRVSRADQAWTVGRPR